MQIIPLVRLTRFHFDNLPPTHLKLLSLSHSVEIWQFRFAAECVADVTSRTLTAEAPSYTTILELDKKVRDFPLPEGFQSPSAAVVATNGGGGTSNTVPGAKADEDIGLSMQRCVLDHIRETGAL